MKIAGDICVYTNHSLLLEKLEPKLIPVVDPAAVTATTAPPTTA